MLLVIGVFSWVFLCKTCSVWTWCHQPYSKKFRQGMFPTLLYKLFLRSYVRAEGSYQHSMHERLGRNVCAECLCKAFVPNIQCTECSCWMFILNILTMEFSGGMFVPNMKCRECSDGMYVIKILCTECSCGMLVHSILCTEDLYKTFCAWNVCTLHSVHKMFGGNIQAECWYPTF